MLSVLTAALVPVLSFHCASTRAFAFWVLRRGLEGRVRVAEGRGPTWAETRVREERVLSG